MLYMVIAENVEKEHTKLYNILAYRIRIWTWEEYSSQWPIEELKKNECTKIGFTQEDLCSSISWLWY